MFVHNRLRFLFILKSYLYYARFFQRTLGPFFNFDIRRKTNIPFFIKQISRPGHQGPPHLKMAITIQIKRFSRRKKRVFLSYIFFTQQPFSRSNGTFAPPGMQLGAQLGEKPHTATFANRANGAPPYAPLPQNEKKRPEPIRLRALDAPGKGIPYSVLTENSAMEGASPEASAHASKRSTRPRCGANSTSCSTGLFTMFENSPSATLRPSSNSR